MTVALHISQTIPTGNSSVHHLISQVHSLNSLLKIWKHELNYIKVKDSNVLIK